MGSCQSSIIVLSSARHNDLDYVDDSIHMLLKRDIEHAKKQGIELNGYRPRNPHPLLMKLDNHFHHQHPGNSAKTEVESITDRSIESVSGHHNNHKKTSSRRQSNQQQAPQQPIAYDEIENVLWHTKNHCDIIDLRDRRQYQ